MFVVFVSAGRIVSIRCSNICGIGLAICDTGIGSVRISIAVSTAGASMIASVSAVIAASVSAITVSTVAVSTTAGAAVIVSVISAIASTIAAVVVNLFLPLINVEVSAGQPETAKQLTELLGIDFGTLLGVFFNIYILPLVAAGYLTLLAKDIQKYWLKHHSERPEQ